MLGCNPGRLTKESLRIQLLLCMSWIMRKLQTGCQMCPLLQLVSYTELKVSEPLLLVLFCLKRSMQVCGYTPIVAKPCRSLHSEAQSFLILVVIQFHTQLVFVNVGCCCLLKSVFIASLWVIMWCYQVVRSLLSLFFFLEDFVDAHL